MKTAKEKYEESKRLDEINRNLGEVIVKLKDIISILEALDSKHILTTKRG